MEILIAVIILSILILIHEWGHFITAKRAGLLVEEFGVGLPPRLWGKRIGETIYSINLLPIGGFVKIYGETPPVNSEQQTVTSGETRAFYEKPLWIRFVVLFSGVFMNFLLGFVILSILLSLGVPAAVSERFRPHLQDFRIEIVGIAPGSPAETAGIKTGDEIVAIEFNGENLEAKSSEEVSEFISRHKGKDVLFTIRRESEEKTFRVRLREAPPEGEGSLGIVMVEAGILKFPWWRSPVEALRLSFELSRHIFLALAQVFGDLFKTGKISEGVAGPIGIVKVTGEVASLGFLRLLNFAALLSINLAVLNLLPIPALDGGRILFLLIEKLRGRPVPRKLETLSHTLGMAILLALILLISIQDIVRLF